MDHELAPGEVGKALDQSEQAELVIRQIDSLFGRPCTRLGQPRQSIIRVVGVARRRTLLPASGIDHRKDVAHAIVIVLEDHGGSTLGASVVLCSGSIAAVIGVGERAEVVASG